ncbi:MAG: hypothetical protein WCW66_00465 [Patescibacteria group bacterium]|jgi:hypothetical protein
MVNLNRAQTMTKQKTSTQLAMRVDQVITLLTFTAIAASFFAAAIILTSYNLAK